MATKRNSGGLRIKAVAYIRLSSAANVGTDKDSYKRQRHAIAARAAAGNAGDRVLEVALQPVVGARLAVSIVVIAINFNRSRAVCG
jgi:hypothetical protein